MDDALRMRLSHVEGVEVLGLVADLPGALAAARAVIVPIWEGGGTRLKVLEALAAGRPVVGTSLGVGGVGFEDGRHGLLGERPAPSWQPRLQPCSPTPSEPPRWGSKAVCSLSATAGRRLSRVLRRCYAQVAARLRADMLTPVERSAADQMT